MDFAISSVTYFQSYGFDTTTWRKSKNGLKALVHLQFAETLMPNIRKDSQVLICQNPSTVFTNLLNSAEWA